MAPRRSRRSRRRGSSRRASAPILRDEITYLTVITPNQTSSVTLSMLPDAVRESTFRLSSFRVSAGSLDVATANKYTDGPAFFQMRQLAVDGVSTIKVSPVFAAGPQPRTFHLQTDKLEYPGPWKGAHLVAVDCLCPNKGYERGVGMSVTLQFTRNHVPTSEACPTLIAYPTVAAL